MKIILVITFFCIAATTVHAAPTGPSLRLAWTPNTEADLSHYNVYRATATSATLAQINAAPVTTTTYVDRALDYGVAYTYAVTAVDISRNESEFSETVMTRTHRRVTSDWMPTIEITRPFAPVATPAYMGGDDFTTGTKNRNPAINNDVNYAPLIIPLIILVLMMAIFQASKEGTRK